MATELLISAPGDDLVRALSTISMTNQDSAYPATNLLTNDPQQVAKSTTTSTTITFTHTTAKRPVILTIHNHKLAGATVTFAGLSVTIPARDSDGQCTNAFLDMRTVPAPSTTQHQLVVTGATSGFGIGRVCLPSTVSAVPFAIGGQGTLEYDTEWPDETEESYTGADLIYDRGLRIRRLRGAVRRRTDQQRIMAIAASAKGRNVPFAVVPDTSVNDAWFARFEMARFTTERRTSGGKVLIVKFGLREVSMGVPL